MNRLSGSAGVFSVHLAAVFLGILLLGLPPSDGETIVEKPARKKKVKFDANVLLGAERVHCNETACVVLVASMHSGEYFAGLERRETATGVEFRKGSRQVQEFPEVLTVEILALVVPCSRDTKLGALEIAFCPSAFLDNLRFDANWQRDGELRPVESLSVRVMRPVWAELDDHREYRLTLRSRGVPLTDHLILSLLSEEGTKIAEFVGDLLNY